MQQQSLREQEQQAKKQITDQNRLIRDGQSTVEKLVREQQSVSDELAALQLQVPELAAVTAR